MRTCTSIELYEKYVTYGGHLTQKQMFTKLVAYLGNDAIVLYINGSASISGFCDYVSRIVKISEVDKVDEGKDILVRRITIE